MEFEPQCKTVADLHREYARVLDMSKNANIPHPWICVKVSQAYGGMNRKLYNHPDFSDEVGSYEFAIAIVEGKPVFRGDELYCANGRKWIAEEENFAVSTDSRLMYGYDKLSWNPPKPKEEVTAKTPTTEGVIIYIEGHKLVLTNLPSPTESWHTERCANEFSIHLKFNTPEEATAMEKIVLGQLSKQM